MTTVKFASRHNTDPKRGIILAFVGVIIIALFAIGLFLISGLANQKKVTRLYEEGIVVDGVVVNKWITGEGERAKYFLTVEYLTDSAGLVKRDFRVDVDDYEHATVQGRIPITYLDGEETEARVGTEFGFDMTPMFLALAGLIIVLAGLAFLMVVFGVTRSKQRPGFEL